MKLTVREAGLADARAIVQLIGEFAADAQGHSPVSEAYVRAYVSSPASHVLLAQLEESVVGMLSYSIRPDLYHAADACLIELVVVHRSARGQGVGRALLAELLSRLDGATCAEVSVAAAPDNQRAISLYRSVGLDEESILLEMHLPAGPAK